MKQPVILETPRLLLQTLDAKDAALVLAYHIENKAFLEEWVPLMPDVFYELDYQTERLNLQIENAVTFYIFKSGESNKIIGQIGISNIVLGAFQSCNLGLGMLGTEINQGYMTEAIQAVVTYIFNELNLHRIEANVMPRNHRSKRLMQKLGFVNEGLSRKYLKINGKWEDHERYVIWRD
jgi:ribosomal-protein-alanine N-acetyltransferase